MSSPLATCVVVALASLSVGYLAGARTARISSGAGSKWGAPQELGGKDDGDLATVNSITEDCKMVLVVRADLSMSVGKIAAQCSHATLACYQILSLSNPMLLRQWERRGQTKITLRCDNEEELLLLQAKAKSLDLCARSIQDAGRTQIAAGSRTVLGIGPGPARLVNQVTGKLRVL